MSPNAYYFTRPATPEEHNYIYNQEKIRYKDEIKKYSILMTSELFLIVLSIATLFIRTILGTILGICFIAIGSFFLYKTFEAMRITKRQLSKIESSTYRIQNVLIQETHIEVTWLSSKLVAYVYDEDGKRFPLYTNLTSSETIVQGARGIMVILEDEKNSFMTFRYRFYPEEHEAN